MYGLVILDENDNVIRPCILWNDGRTKKECVYLNNVIGKAALSDYTANIAFAGFSAPKLLWIKGNQPENFRRIKKIMLPKDYLAYMLTGEFSTDVSDASGTLLFDVKKRCWSEEMCRICGILNASYNLRLRNIKAYIPEYPVGDADDDVFMGFHCGNTNS